MCFPCHQMKKEMRLFFIWLYQNQIKMQKYLVHCHASCVDFMGIHLLSFFCHNCYSLKEKSLNCLFFYVHDLSYGVESFWLFILWSCEILNWGKLVGLVWKRIIDPSARDQMKKIMFFSFPLIFCAMETLVVIIYFCSQLCETDVTFLPLMILIITLFWTHTHTRSFYSEHDGSAYSRSCQSFGLLLAYAVC